MVICKAELKDLQTITDIFNAAVVNTTATAEISEMTSEFKTEINHAAGAMTRIDESSQAGLRLASESDQALAEIEEAIGNVLGAIENIATSAAEQSSGAEEVSKNIEGVATVPKESAEQALELSEAAAHLNDQVTALNSLMGQFKV